MTNVSIQKNSIKCQTRTTSIGMYLLDKYVVYVIIRYPNNKRRVAGVAKQETQRIAQNKKAYHDYFVIEKFEAGIELFGTEVKSARQGKLNLKDSWCSIKDGEIFVNGMHISPYEQGNIFNREPRRVRRLLMHKREILRLFGLMKQQGYAIIPLSAYFKRGRMKVEIGLCKGKKNYDKREDIARKDANRDIQRSLKDMQQ